MQYLRLYRIIKEDLHINTMKGSKLKTLNSTLIFMANVHIIKTN